MIRKAVSEDWKEIQRLNALVYLSDSENDSDLIVDQPYCEASIGYYKAVANGDIGFCFVYEVEAKIVGYIALAEKRFHHRTGKYLEVENMGVDLSYRRMKIGRQLIEEAKKVAKENGYTKLFVTAYWGNTVARSFYESNGFRSIDTSLEVEV